MSKKRERSISHVSLVGDYARLFFKKVCEVCSMKNNPNACITFLTENRNAFFLLYQRKKKIQSFSNLKESLKGVFDGPRDNRIPDLIKSVYKHFLFYYSKGPYFTVSLEDCQKAVLHFRRPGTVLKVHDIIQHIIENRDYILSGILKFLLHVNFSEPQLKYIFSKCMLQFFLVLKDANNIEKRMNLIKGMIEFYSSLTSGITKKGDGQFILIEKVKTLQILYQFSLLFHFPVENVKELVISLIREINVIEKSQQLVLKFSRSYVNDISQALVESAYSFSMLLLSVMNRKKKKFPISILSMKKNPQEDTSLFEDPDVSKTMNFLYVKGRVDKEGDTNRNYDLKGLYGFILLIFSRFCNQRFDYKTKGNRAILKDFWNPLGGQNDYDRKKKKQSLLIMIRIEAFDYFQKAVEYGAFRFLSVHLLRSNLFEEKVNNIYCSFFLKSLNDFFAGWFPKKEILKPGFQERNNYMYCLLVKQEMVLKGIRELKEHQSPPHFEEFMSVFSALYKRDPKFARFLFYEGEEGKDFIGLNNFLFYKAPLFITECAKSLGYIHGSFIHYLRLLSVIAKDKVNAVKVLRLITKECKFNLFSLSHFLTMIKLLLESKRTNQEDENRIIATLRLFEKIIKKGEETQAPFLVKNEFNLMELLFKLTGGQNTSPKLMGQVYKVIAAFMIGNPQYAFHIWNFYNSMKLIEMGKLARQVESIEGKIYVYDETFGFVYLMEKLIQRGIPIFFNPSSFTPYFEFIRKKIFEKKLKFRSLKQKWKIYSCCLKIFLFLIKNYEPCEDDFLGIQIGNNKTNITSHQRNNRSVKRSSSFNTLRHLLTKGNFLTKIFSILFSHGEVGKGENIMKENAILLSLKLVYHSLQKLELFRYIALSRNKRDVNMRVQFFSVDEIYNSEMIMMFYNYVNSDSIFVRLFALKIITLLAKRKNKMLDIFLAKEKHISILVSMIKILKHNEIYEEDEEDVDSIVTRIQKAHHELKLTALDLLMSNFGARDSISLYLLGFCNDELYLNRNRKNNCMREVLGLLNQPLKQRKHISDVIIEKCYELIYKLCSEERVRELVFVILHKENFFEKLLQSEMDSISTIAALASQKSIGKEIMIAKMVSFYKKMKYIMKVNTLRIYHDAEYSIDKEMESEVPGELDGEDDNLLFEEADLHKQRKKRLPESTSSFLRKVNPHHGLLKLLFFAMEDYDEDDELNLEHIEKPDKFSTKLLQLLTFAELVYEIPDRKLYSKRGFVKPFPTLHKPLPLFETSFPVLVENIKKNCIETDENSGVKTYDLSKLHKVMLYYINENKQSAVFFNRERINKVLNTAILWNHYNLLKYGVIGYFDSWRDLLLVSISKLNQEMVYSKEGGAETLLLYTKTLLELLNRQGKVIDIEMETSVCKLISQLLLKVKIFPPRKFDKNMGIVILKYLLHQILKECRAPNHNNQVIYVSKRNAGGGALQVARSFLYLGLMNYLKTLNDFCFFDGKEDVLVDVLEFFNEKSVLIRLVATDCLDGKNLWKSIAYSTLTYLLNFDYSHKWVKFLHRNGYLTQFVDLLSMQKKSIVKTPLLNVDRMKDGMVFKKDNKTWEVSSNELVVFENLMGFLSKMCQRDCLELNMYHKVLNVIMYDICPIFNVIVNDQVNSDMKLSSLISFHQLMIPILKLITSILLNYTKNPSIVKLVNSFVMKYHRVILFILSPNSASQKKEDEDQMFGFEERKTVVTNSISIPRMEEISQIFLIFYHLSYNEELSNSIILKYESSLLRCFAWYVSVNRFDSFDEINIPNKEREIGLTSPSEIREKLNYQIERNFIAYVRARLSIGNVYTKRVLFTHLVRNLSEMYVVNESKASVELLFLLLKRNTERLMALREPKKRKVEFLEDDNLDEVDDLDEGSFKLDMENIDFNLGVKKKDDTLDSKGKEGGGVRSNEKNKKEENLKLLRDKRWLNERKEELVHVIENTLFAIYITLRWYLDDSKFEEDKNFSEVFYTNGIKGGLKKKMLSIEDKKALQNNCTGLFRTLVDLRKRVLIKFHDSEFVVKYVDQINRVLKVKV